MKGSCCSFQLGCCSGQAHTHQLALLTPDALGKLQTTPFLSTEQFKFLLSMSFPPCLYLACWDKYLKVFSTLFMGQTQSPVKQLLIAWRRHYLFSFAWLLKSPVFLQLPWSQCFFNTNHRSNSAKSPFPHQLFYYRTVKVTRKKYEEKQ